MMLGFGSSCARFLTICTTALTCTPHILLTAVYSPGIRHSIMDDNHNLNLDRTSMPRALTLKQDSSPGHVDTAKCCTCHKPIHALTSHHHTMYIDS